MKKDDALAISNASVNRACGETISHVEVRARGTIFCPKCGEWIGIRSFDFELGWCNQCAHPSFCVICNDEIRTNAKFCQGCKEKFYVRIRYLVKRYCLSEDAAIQELINDGKQLHKGTHERHGDVQEMPEAMGLD